MRKQFVRYGNIADIGALNHTNRMRLSVAEQAGAWIEYSRFSDPNEVPADLWERGWKLYECAFDDPTFAWEAIKEIVGRYTDEALFTDSSTEAKHILGNLGAGPLEVLLAQHGEALISDIEVKAKSDRRFFWTLACVWQNSMSDDLWSRVQRATGGFSP